MSPKNEASPLYGLQFPKGVPVLQEGTHDLVQKEAKKLLPPGCTVWRANYRGEWCFHLEPHQRHLSKWSDHAGDSYEALLCGVRQAWRMFLFDNLLQIKDCPIKDLFPS